MFRNELQSAYGSGRVTAPRAVIAQAVAARDCAFTVDDLATDVRATDPGAGATATVYRAVAAMEAAGHIERVGSRAGSALYARCATHAHHHHIVCDGCGRVAHTECPVVAPADGGPRPDGFVVTRHEVTLYGLCPACARSGAEV